MGGQRCGRYYVSLTPWHASPVAIAAASHAVSAAAAEEMGSIPSRLNSGQLFDSRAQQRVRRGGYDDHVHAALAGFARRSRPCCRPNCPCAAMAQLGCVPTSDQIKWSEPSPTGAQRGAGRRSERRTLRADGQMARRRSLQPPALPPERPFHHRARRHVVGRHRHEIRPGSDRADGPGHVRHAFRKTGAFRRRQGRGRTFCSSSAKVRERRRRPK